MFLHIPMLAWIMIGCFAVVGLVLVLFMPAFLIIGAIGGINATAHSRSKR